MKPYGWIFCRQKNIHPRTYDLYDIFCAILYLLKEGCFWRAIPHDFLKWENVNYHYDLWAASGENGVSLLDRVLRKVEAEREKDRREPKTTMVIVDPKNIQNVSTAKEKGYEAGKNIWHKAI